MNKIKELRIEFSHKTPYTKFLVLLYIAIILVNIAIGTPLIGLCFIPLLLFFWKSDINASNNTRYDFSFTDYITASFMPLIFVPMVNGLQKVLDTSAETEDIISYMVAGLCIISIVFSSIIYFRLLKERQKEGLQRATADYLFIQHPYKPVYSSQLGGDPLESWDEYYEKIRSLAKQKSYEWLAVKKIKTSRKILLINLGVEPTNALDENYTKLSDADLKIYDSFQEYSTQE